MCFCVLWRHVDTLSILVKLLRSQVWQPYAWKTLQSPKQPAQTSTQDVLEAAHPTPAKAKPALYMPIILPYLVKPGVGGANYRRDHTLQGSPRSTVVDNGIVNRQ